MKGYSKGSFVSSVGFLAVLLVCVGLLTGVASAQGQVEISQAGDLNEVSVEGNYVLVDDINASDIKDFEPIGNEEESFVGSFDGDGYVISGLTINRSDSEHVGFFGYVGSEGTVTNVGLEDAEVTGGESTGVLVGRNEGEVSRSHVTGSVEGGDNVGGLVGRNVGTITESYASANVAGGDRVGGLVGRNVGTISESYSTGAVEGVSSAGGAVGSNVGEITDTYTTADVEGDAKMGGLVGDDVGGTVERTYAGGNMGAGMGSGGLVGSSNGNTEVAESYWNTETLSDGGFDSGVALTTAEMTGANAVGNMEFDFDEVWESTDSDYPVLAWQVHGYGGRFGNINAGTPEEDEEGEEEVEEEGEDENETEEGQGEDYQPPGEGLLGFGALVGVFAVLVGGAVLRARR